MARIRQDLQALMAIIDVGSSDLTRPGLMGQREISLILDIPEAEGLWPSGVEYGAGLCVRAVTHGQDSGRWPGIAGAHNP